MKSVVAAAFLALLAVLYGQSTNAVPEPVVITDKHVVEWEPNAEPDIAGYRIFMTGPNTNAVFFVASTTNTRMLVLAELCKTNRLQTGIYKLWATAVNTAGLESDPSSNVARNIGYPPSVVINAVFTNTPPK